MYFRIQNVIILCVFPDSTDKAEFLGYKKHLQLCRYCQTVSQSGYTTSQPSNMRIPISSRFLTFGIIKTFFFFYHYDVCEMVFIVLCFIFFYYREIQFLFKYFLAIL